MIRAIVTDIEGTTSSLSFVRDVLFPYAKSHLAEFIRSNSANSHVRAILSDVASVCGRSLSDEQAIDQLLAWIDEDKKVTPLKSLQGLIWEAGYACGDLQGHIYPDAARKLREWFQAGLLLYVFSSGSVHAQKLLFRHTDYGDLTPWFSGYFDTHIGPKQDTESYRKIAVAIGLEPSEILFLSDIATELDAAREAGMNTCQLLREGGLAETSHEIATDFDAIII